MSDTTTRLSLGAQDGDRMDESLIVQAGDGVTQAKRPRVVIAGDAAGAAVVDPVAADPGKNPYSIPAFAICLVDDMPQSYVPGELRPVSMTPEGRLRTTTIPAPTAPDFFGEMPDFFSVNFGASLSTNPWS